MKRMGSYVIFLLMVFLLATTFACEKKTNRMAGKYEAEITEGTESAIVYLELAENGRGSWAVEEDNVDFRWDEDDSHVRLHTLSGGVIVGKIEGKSLNIHLPGVGPHHFEKKEP